MVRTDLLNIHYHFESSEIKKPSRRVHKPYQITPGGLAELKKWLHEPVEKEIVRFELLLKLYFSHLITPGKMIMHLQEFQSNRRKEFDLFEQYERQLQASMELHENHRQVLMVLQLGKKIWKAYDEWCRETSTLLEELADKT